MSYFQKNYRMARKKADKEQAIKKKGLFDHLNQIRYTKSSTYWDDLSESERKSFSSFMVNRYLSMKMDIIELVSYVQTLNMNPEMLERFYREFLPKDNSFVKYMKGKSEMNNEEIDILAEYLEVSRREAIIYYLMLKERGELNIVDEIKKLYGQRFEK